MLLIPILLFIIPALFGAVVVAGSKVLTEKVTVVLMGTILGLVVHITATYILTILGLPLSAAIVITLPVLFIALFVVLIKTQAWLYWVSLPTDKILVVALVVLLALSSIVSPKLLIQKDDGLYTGIVNAFGDIAWHATNITSFAVGQSFPPQNPIFAHTKLYYPFLTNFSSAVLLVSGASLPQSVNLPAFILIPVLLGLIYVFVRELTNSKTAAVIALLLFLFGGATMGISRLPADWQESGKSLVEFLWQLPNRNYSGVGTDEQGFHFSNPVTTLLLPQRAFLFGIPISLSLLLLLLKGTQDVLARRKAFILAGVLAGFIPLFHAHSILALVPVIIGLFILAPSWPWIWFVIPALVVGLPEISYYIGQETEPGAFFRWGPGWLAGDTNWMWYWLKNTGLLLPVTLLGFFLPAPRQLKILSAAALIIFAVANTWLFAPWAWDNFKLFVYFFIFSLPLVAWVSTRALKQTNWILKPLIVLVIAAHLLSAGLDLWKLTLPTAATWGEWDNEAIRAAQKITETTPVNATILTAPIHNSPVALTGRRSYLGFAAHVWSHGAYPWHREDALKPFYEGQLTTLPETTADYILVGPVERSKYPNLVIRPGWKLITQSGSYQLYSLP